jgi:hypothetical protein
MNHMSRRHTGCAIACAGVLAAVQVPAVEVAGATKQAPRKAVPEVAANRTDHSQALRQGVVTALGARADQVEIQGRWHRIDAATRFFRASQATQADVLRKGQMLRFTLAPGDHATLGVVYVP